MLGEASSPFYITVSGPISMQNLIKIYHAVKELFMSIFIQRPRHTKITLVNVYVDLVVFTHIAGTSETGSGRYWCLYYIENHAICLKDYRIRSFLSIRHSHGDLCKHLGIDSSTDLDTLCSGALVSDSLLHMLL